MQSHSDTTITSWVSFTPSPFSNTTTNIINTTTSYNGNATSDGAGGGGDVFVVTAKEDEGFISDQSLRDFMAIFQYMMPVLCVMACFFCLLNAIVYWQQRAAPFALYLVAVDLGDGLCSFVELLHSVVYFALPGDAYGLLVVKWYLAKYVAASCRRAAVCLNAFACMERFFAIAFPLKSVSRRVCARPALVILTVFVTCLVAHVYFALEYEVAEDELTGEWSLTHTRLRKSHPEAFALWALVNSVIFAYSPLVAIMVLNTTLLVVLRRHASSLKNVRRVRGATGSKDTTSAGQPPPSSLLQKQQNHHHHHHHQQLQQQQHDDDDDESGLISTVSAETMSRDPKTRGAEKTVSGEEAETATAAKKNTRRKTTTTMTKKTENTNNNNSSSSSTSQTTKMVMVFTTVVLVMALPRMLNSSARSVLASYGPKGRERNLYNAVSLLSQITSHFTETALFWVSLAYSRSFRRILLLRLPTRRLFGRWLGAAKSSLPATSSSDVIATTSSSSSTR